MSVVFLKILNMGIAAGWLILAVILVRMLLKKAPKWIICLLWAFVAIRLICPFSLESAFSLIPSREMVPAQIAEFQKPAIDSGITIVNETVNPILANSFAPDPADSANPLQIVIPVISYVWLVGIAALLIYACVSFRKLKKSVSASVSLGKGIMTCDEIKEPFILGVVRPVIYVPSFMERSQETLMYVILHESAHLKRRDHWWKPLGYLLLAIYWFHPLCWIAYLLFCRDIEMACDERVIRDMDREHMAAYSQALLDLSFPGKKIAACPLAFGEVGVKQRVKGVFNYKKPTFWILLTAAIVCVFLVLCLMTDPFSERSLAEHHRTEALNDETHFGVIGTGKEGVNLTDTDNAGIDADTTDMHVTMTAVITEIISDTLMLVRPETNPQGLISVPTRYLSDSLKPQVGDTVEIEFNGLILETYPEQLGRIYSVKVVKQAQDDSMDASEQAKDASTDASKQPQGNSADVIGQVKSGMTVTTKTVYANRTTADSRIVSEFLNPPEPLLKGSARRFPVFKFDTVEDLEHFKELFQNDLMLDQGYDEVPSFHGGTVAYDEEFFADHTLIAAYVEASSGSYRYALQDILIQENIFCMDVIQTNNPEVITDDMAGWFVLAEVLDSDLKGCQGFEARLLVVVE